ncbi:PTS sugar transporter subunit IIA [Acidithiobacillus caldus]|uniref:PTS sugar transporter subunit IIA n=1 Tax=Acidithiobacillus caldus TaxID=33059 RepID=UPI0029C0DA18|nr:hypothetical protein [Acidithiobacillus caldus]
MNRIVLLTHSGLGRGFLSVLEHIYGAVPDAVELREIGADSDLEWEKAQLRQRIGQLAPGEALLILTDLFGATPTNIVPVEMLGARANGDGCQPAHAFARAIPARYARAAVAGRRARGCPRGYSRLSP